MDILRLIRPFQWIKNIFVYIPLFFGGYLFNGAMWIESTLAFIAFSLMASAIYCINDIKDVKSDKEHPEKKKRPIASGNISITAAWIMSLILVTGSEIICMFAVDQNPLDLVIVINLYLVLNIAYCFGLKRISIVDVLIIASGFVLRLVAGGVSCGIELSPWIVLMTFLLALFMAFAKRRDDVIIRESTGLVTRRNTVGYTLPYLNLILGMLAGVTMVCYIMYTVSPEVIERFNNPYIYASSIFVLAGIIRYLQIAIVNSKSGSPTKILLHDRFIQACCIMWVLFFAVIIYVR